MSANAYGSLRLIKEENEVVSSCSSDSSQSRSLALSQHQHNSSGMRSKLRSLKFKCEQRHRKLDQNFQKIASGFKEIARSFHYQRERESLIETKFDSLMSMNARIFDSIRENGARVRIFNNSLFLFSHVI